VIDQKITPKGKEFLEALLQQPSEIIVKKTAPIDNSQFEEFWDMFPRNDTFEYKGKKFQGSRALRTGKKDEMRAKYYKILAEGVYTHSQILNALNSEISQKKENSFKSNSNKLSFLNAMPAYLNQRIFESFIEESPIEEKEDTSGGVLI
jgi:hypothetical protein